MNSFGRILWALLFSAMPSFCTAFVYSAPLSASGDTVQFMGEFLTEDNSGEDIPPITLYFDGAAYQSQRSGVFTINLSRDEVERGLLKDLSLMICKRLDIEHEKGYTLAGMKIKNLQKCSWYKLDRELCEDEDTGENRWCWSIQKQDIGDNDYVPDRCLVVFMSNDNVAEVCDTKHLASSSDVIGGFFPTIVLKNPTDDSALQRISDKGVLERIHFRQYVVEPEHRIMIQNGVECRRDD